MHIPFKALVVSLSLASFSASGAPTKDPVKAITAATSWNEVIAQIEGRFPKLIVDELRAATKDVAFPVIRSYKGQLVVTDSSGARITLAFGKDGTALLNGKPLSIRPLATVDAEVKRISSGDGKTASLMEYLVPDAQAAGMIGSGMAALAFASSNAWKADACAEEELSEELTQSCPLMGVGMVIPASASEAVAKTNKPYKTVSLRCPSQNNGILEQIRKNEDGITSRMRLKYKDGQVVQIIAEAAERGKGFELIQLFEMTKKQDPDVHAQGLRVIELVAPVMEKICNGPAENKQRYNQLLESNRKQFASFDSPTSQSRESSMDVQ